MLKALPHPNTAHDLTKDETCGSPKNCPPAINVSNRSKEHSQHSQGPQAVHAPFNLDDEEI